MNSEEGSIPVSVDQHWLFITYTTLDDEVTRLLCTYDVLGQQLCTNKVRRRDNAEKTSKANVKRTCNHFGDGCFRQGKIIVVRR